MGNAVAEATSELTLLSVVLRLGFATMIGALVGMERSSRGRGAGVKTHALVCMGSALVMLTSEYMRISLHNTGDMARMGAQIISGIGFLGAGTIIVTGRNHVRGLTTAAGLWVCACEGMSIGIGFLERRGRRVGVYYAHSESTCKIGSESAQPREII